MSALAMILMAAIGIPGNGPEMVSGEVKQGLDLSGEWEGVWYSLAKPPREAQLRDEHLFLWIPDKGMGYAADIYFVCIDEGDGKMHLAASLFSPDDGRSLGIYRWDGDRILICYRVRNQVRPTSFQAGDGQFLLILHRVKPRK